MPGAAVRGLTRARKPDVVALELVSARLWEPTADGYVIHDYTAWNSSKESVEIRREAKREAGRAGGMASARSRTTAPPKLATGGEAEAKHDAPNVVEAESKHGASPLLRGWFKPGEAKTNTDDRDQMTDAEGRSRSISERVVPRSPPENPSGGPAATVTDRVLEELGRSPKTRNLATVSWASELVLLAGAVRADDLCAAIRKCVVGAPEGLTEAALKQRLVGFAAKARNIEGVERAKHEESEKPVQRPPGYIPLGVRPDIPLAPPRFTRDPNAPMDAPLPAFAALFNSVGGKA